MGTRLLIDADIVRTRCAAAAQHKEYIVYAKGLEDQGPLLEVPYVKDYKAWMKKEGFTDDDVTIDVRQIVEPKHYAFHLAKKVIEGMLEAFDTDNFDLYLTRGVSYRKMLVPEYKAHRKDMDRPFWEGAVHDYLIDVWGAKEVSWIEADDQLGIEQMRDPDEDTCICTADKDLWTIPGKHYDFTVEGSEVEETTEEMARHMFWYQMLVGDTADNVKGVPGVGAKTAEKLLVECNSKQDYYAAVRDAYHKKFGDAGDREMLLCATALYILRKEHDYWTPEWYEG